MDPVDDWCREALALRRVGLLILQMEKRQEGGDVNPEVAELAAKWLRGAELLQRAHEEAHEAP